MPAKIPAKTCEVFEYLKVCSAENRTVPYSEIGGAVGLANQSVKRPLNYIRDKICNPKELPWITALAVMKDTGYPGAGWPPPGIPIKHAHLPVSWSGIVLQVFATNWPAVQPIADCPKPATMPAKTKEVFDCLKMCADQMRPIIYDEIGDNVGLASTDVSSSLDYIRDVICRPRRLPWISALGVNSATRMPSEGWLPNGVAIKVDHLPMFWRGVVLQVYAVDWSKVEVKSQP